MRNTIVIMKGFTKVREFFEFLLSAFSCQLIDFIVFNWQLIAESYRLNIKDY